jgi:hypothetical protein
MRKSQIAAVAEALAVVNAASLYVEERGSDTFQSVHEAAEKAWISATERVMANGDSARQVDDFNRPPGRGSRYPTSQPGPPAARTR